MSLKLPLGGFNWDEATSQFNEDFINICNTNSHIGYFIEADFQYPEKLLELYNDLSFLPEKIGIEKVEKLAVNLHDKKRIFHSHNKFRTNIKSQISFGKLHRIIKFNQKAWLKSYIDMNVDL